MLKINWVLKSDYVNCYFNQILKSIITFPQQYTLVDSGNKRTVHGKWIHRENPSWICFCSFFGFRSLLRFSYTHTRVFGGGQLSAFRTASDPIGIVIVTHAFSPRYTRTISWSKGEKKTATQVEHKETGRALN